LNVLTNIVRSLTQIPATTACAPLAREVGRRNPATPPRALTHATAHSSFAVHGFVRIAEWARKLLDEGDADRLDGICQAGGRRQPGRSGE